jgi:hypothetical protein
MSRRRRLYEDGDLSDRLVDGLLCAVRSLAGILWISSIVATFAVIAAHSIFWLRNGSWTWWTINDELQFGGILLWRTNWVGVQHLLDWIAGLPIVVLIPMLGLATSVITFVSGKFILGRR